MIRVNKIKKTTLSNKLTKLIESNKQLIHLCNKIQETLETNNATNIELTRNTREILLKLIEEYRENNNQ